MTTSTTGPSGPAGTTVDTGAAAFASLGRTGSRLVVAWTAGDEARLRSYDATLRALDAPLVDGNAFLRDSRPGSIGAIIATHLVEHLELDDLVEFLDLAASRLRPGGVLIAETPNPAALIVLGNSYILDPTHVRPLHPSLLSFLCEGAGFRDVRLSFELETDAGEDELATLLKLTERYCVVLQTLARPPRLSAGIAVADSAGA